MATRSRSAPEAWYAAAALHLLVLGAPRTGRADQLAQLVVRSTTPGTKYELVDRDTLRLVPPCARFTNACRHSVEVGRYWLAVLPDGDIPPGRYSLTVSGPTTVTIKPGSRTVERIGISLLCVGGAATVAGLIGYMFAVTGSTVGTDGSKTSAQIWGVTAVSGVVLSLGGLLTYASGTTTITVAARF